MNGTGHRAAALALALAILAGCGDGRRIALEEVTPQARTAIARIAGPDRILSIHQDGSGDRLLYHLVIDRGQRGRLAYTVDATGTMRD
jgi:hypothetical protein